MSNSLTRHFKLPHGLAVGMVHPYVMLFNARFLPEKYRKIALALGVKPAVGAEDLAVGWQGAMMARNLLEKLSLPSSLAQLGVPEASIPKLAQEALSELSIDYNPVKIDVGQMERLFLSAVRGDPALMMEDFLGL